MSGRLSVNAPRQGDAAVTTPQAQPLVIVPLADLNRAAVAALAYARSQSPNVTAVHVTDDLAAAEDLQQRWERWAPGVPLIIVESPYRALVGPLLSFVETVRRAHGASSSVVVVLPEVLPAHWYERLLHRRTARRLHHALLHQAGVIVATVPFHLGACAQDARRLRHGPVHVERTGQRVPVPAAA